MKLQQRDSVRLPYDDGSFDGAYAVHTLYFWSHPHEHLRELHRVMKDGARLVLGFRSREDNQAVANFPSTIYRFYTCDEVSGFLTDVGFTCIQILNQRTSSNVMAFGVARRLPW